MEFQRAPSFSFLSSPLNALSLSFDNLFYSIELIVFVFLFFDSILYYFKIEKRELLFARRFSGTKILISKDLELEFI